MSYPPNEIKQKWLLLLLTLTILFITPAAYGQSVVIYEEPNFEGRSRSFTIGNHRLFTPADFIVWSWSTEVRWRASDAQQCRSAIHREAGLTGSRYTLRMTKVGGS
jgi:hypothetical protein